MQRIDFSLFESEIETFTNEFYFGVKEPEFTSEIANMNTNEIFNYV